MVAAVLLAHPIAWSLAPGATGLVGSLVTLSLVVAAVARGELAQQRRAAAARAAAAAEEEEEAVIGAVSALATATPVAWGLAAAAIGMSRAYLSVPAVALVAWGWWRVVSKSASSSSSSWRPPQPQRDGDERQWGQQPRRRTDHLPGRPPRGATGAVERVLSSRDFVEVLGLDKGGGRNANGLTLAALERLDDKAVRAAWRRLVLSVHPDRQHASSSGGGVGAKEAFNLVAEAFESLKDAAARARYARELDLI